MKRKEGTRRLRRMGHRVLQWFITVFFLALAALAVEKMGIHGPNGAPVGLTAIFATIFVVQRILRSRVILRQHDMRVINAIFEYRVMCGAVEKVFVDNRGNLKIETKGGAEIFVAAYSGSLVDSFVGSAEKAAGEIRRYVASRSTTSQDPEIRRRYKLSWVSDIWLAAAVACGVWAAINNSAG
ncbi:hypothetical protein [Streptomyces celluloflavus]|uniref:hypothetical protein n=1 Tax=Streptomyces celluloflavus TaxID=58344 RepID=UPI0034604B4A|nr:hypothetical protein OG717_30720 [Streptomyces celluloflavus]